MVLLPSAEQDGGVVEIVGTAGTPVAAALLKDVLGNEGQVPSFAVTV
jgi:hypothetical protein